MFYAHLLKMFYLLLIQEISKEISFHTFDSNKFDTLSIDKSTEYQHTNFPQLYRDRKINIEKKQSNKLISNS